MSFTSIAMSEANTNKSVVSTAGSVISKGLTQNKDKEKEVTADSVDKAFDLNAANTEKLSKEMEMAQRARQELANRIAAKRALQFNNTVIGGK